MIFRYKLSGLVRDFKNLFVRSSKKDFTHRLDFRIEKHRTIASNYSSIEKKDLVPYSYKKFMDDFIFKSVK